MLMRLSAPRSRPIGSQEKMVALGIELGTSGPEAKNYDHGNTEAVRQASTHSNFELVTKIISVSPASPPSTIAPY
jgi:hypothetical protein